MIELFYEGGPLYMGILTLEALLMLSIAVFVSLPIIRGKKLDNHKVGLIKSIGLLSLITGIFCQLIGLYQGFNAIEQAESISPAMLAGGLKVSMITTIYGFIIYIVALLIVLLLQGKTHLAESAS